MFQPAVYASIIIGGLFVVLWLIVRKIKDRSVYLKHIPGPPPNLLFGNTLDFIGGSREFLQVIKGYLDKYGDTIIVHDGMFSWLIVSVDYEFNQLIFNSSIHIQKSDQYKYMEPWLGDGLLTSTGEKWKSHRKILTPTFHFTILQDFNEIFNSVGNNLIEKLEKECGKNSTDVFNHVSLYALDVICEAAMGVKINALDCQNSEYIRSIKTMCNIIVERSLSPINPAFYPLTLNFYKQMWALKNINQHVNKVIDEKINYKQNEAVDRKSNQDDFGMKKRKAFLDMLLECKINGEPLTRKDLLDEVNTFMFEGHDTTAAAISFALFLLSTHLDVQEKVFKEQKKIFNDNLENVSPTINQLNEMKYLDLVIKETLRLYPSVPFFGRRLVEDLEFKGTLYPKGMIFIIFPFVYHRNPHYFPEPEKFIPERFENSTGEKPFSYTPFSAGPRNCIGQKFAMLEMLSILSKIIRNFELTPATPEHKIDLAAETILTPKNGIRLSLKKRKH